MYQQPLCQNMGRRYIG